MNENYALQVGQGGFDRLKLVDEVLGPYSRAFLTELGLKEGMVVADIGCGTGTMSVWMAELVGPTGKVVAVDASAAQLEIARNRARDQGLENIEFIEATAETMPLAEDTFDMVYCRFLLMHLTDPKAVIKIMADAVKSGGIVACDEPTTTSFFTYPQIPIFDQIHNMYLAMGANRSVDYDIGDKLYLMFAELGLELTLPRFVQPLFSLAAVREYLEVGAKEILPTLIKDGITTAEVAEMMMQQLWAAMDSQPGYYAAARQAQVAGRKA